MEEVINDRETDRKQEKVGLRDVFRSIFGFLWVNNDVEEREELLSEIPELLKEPSIMQKTMEQPETSNKGKGMNKVEVDERAAQEIAESRVQDQEEKIKEIGDEG